MSAVQIKTWSISVTYCPSFIPFPMNVTAITTATGYTNDAIRKGTYNSPHKGDTILCQGVG